MKFYEKGKAFYDKADYVRAGLEFKNAIQIDPKFAEARYMLGMANLQQGNVRGATAPSPRRRAQSGARAGPDPAASCSSAAASRRMR
jgi:Flp pilus assembly protein TadD